MSTSFIERPKLSGEHEALAHVLNSRLFANAPLLSSFLLYVCRRASEEGATRISEQEIGVNVFHRAAGYDAAEDNIVRNYARQLRKRLEEYYATDGQFDPLRVEIPKGGYIPRFTARTSTIEIVAPEEPAPGVIPEQRPEEPSTTETASPVGRYRALVVTLLCCLPILCFVTFYIARHYDAVFENGSRRNILWSQLFTSSKDTLLVPADAALGTIEEITGRTFSLAEYENGLATNEPEPAYLTSLKTRRFTSVVDLDIIAKLGHLPGVVWNRAIIRASRNLRIEDFNNNNAILIGSIHAMPWIEAFQSNLNFRFEYRPFEHRAWIDNLKPRAGEATVYQSDWKGFSKKTYAVIAFVPNLNKTGHVLLIQGLDGAGTEAAAGVLFNGDELNEVLHKVRRPDGTLGNFEVLIEANAIDNHATSIHIAALRTPN